MLQRRDIEARIVRQMTRWNVNTIAGFNASAGAPSMRYKRNEFYIDRSAKWWRRKEKWGNETIFRTFRGISWIRKPSLVSENNKEITKNR